MRRTNSGSCGHTFKDHLPLSAQDSWRCRLTSVPLLSHPPKMADLSDNLLHEVEEDERTPRPRKTVSNEQRISRTLPPLNFPMPDPSAGRRQISPQTARRSNSTTSDSNLLSSTELSTEHSHSRSSQRSRSQRLKHLADFQLADGQVEIIRLGHSGTPFPKPMQELVQSLAKIQGRTAVVPKAVKSKVAARMEKFWPL